MCDTKCFLLIEILYAIVPLIKICIGNALPLYIMLINIHDSEILMPWSHLFVKPPRMSNVRQIWDVPRNCNVLSRSATYYIRSTNDMNEGILVTAT